MTNFSDLVGQTLVSIEGAVNGSEEIIFTADNGRKWQMIHYQDCCESVSVEDFDGDINDLIGVPILQAEEVSNHNYDDNNDYESCTWTFYKLGTIKGYTTIRWLGVSNGCYSESASFEEIK